MLIKICLSWNFRFLYMRSCFVVLKGCFRELKYEYEYLLNSSTCWMIWKFGFEWCKKAGNNFSGRSKSGINYHNRPELSTTIIFCPDFWIRLLIQKITAAILRQYLARFLAVQKVWTRKRFINLTRKNLFEFHFWYFSLWIFKFFGILHTSVNV